MKVKMYQVFLGDRHPTDRSGRFGGYYNFDICTESREPLIAGEQRFDFQDTERSGHRTFYSVDKSELRFIGEFDV